MKSRLGFIFSILACLVLAGAAYQGAIGGIDSLYAFRSPLKDQPPAPQAPAAPGLTRRVVFVLVDALRADTAWNPEVMPFLNGLKEKGAYATMHSRPPSYSEAGYSVLLTGAWPDLSDGPAMNLDYAEIPTWTQDNLFSAAHRSGLQTAVSGFYWFEKLIPQVDVSTSFYTSGEDRHADEDVLAAALPWLQQPNLNLVLIHLDQVDYAGHHEGGPRDPNWDAAAKRVDGMLAEIAGSLDFSQDTLFICSDHGQIDAGGHGGNEAVVLTEPFVLVGKGVQPGSYPAVSMTDVSPTLAALLGVNLPASNEGRVLADMLDASPEWKASWNSANLSQQNTLLQRYAEAIGSTTHLETSGTSKDGSAGDSHPLQTLEGLRNSRLSAERQGHLFPVAGFTLFLFAVIGFLLYLLGLWQPRGLFWSFAGGLTYLVVFNLRYAVLDGHMYSLSSVVGDTELIVYVLTTSLLGLLAGFLVALFGSRAWRSSPKQAAGQAFGVVFITLACLILPVAWSSYLNGFTAAWTLPDFSSWFLGFLSEVQILMVAGLGLVLAGLTALFVWAGRRLRKSEPDSATQIL